MKFGVVFFPGANSADCYYVIEQVLGHPVSYIQPDERELGQFDCIIIPGGFSYGDYLRAGALAGATPVMARIADFAEKGGLVLGIGNGFQVLLNTGLLPGAMRVNDNLLFQCHDVFLKVENSRTPFTNRYRQGEVIKYTIAHGEGNYFIDKDDLAQLEQKGQVVFRYCTESGDVIPAANPNGSVGNIAGVCNEKGNVFGLMPHPERCSEEILGNTFGLRLFSSILDWWGICQQEGVMAHE